MQTKRLRLLMTQGRVRPSVVLPLLCGLAFASASEPLNEPYQQALEKVAQGIEQLKSKYPQLQDFDPHSHFDRDRLAITYGFNTHRATTRGGWTSGVPEPADNGVWLFIDLHDPASMAQIHQQPIVPRWTYREMEGMILLREGISPETLWPAITALLAEGGWQPKDRRRKGELHN